MAFPFISSQTGGNSGANATSHTINLPTGIGVGDLLIVVFSTDGDAGTISGWPSGWTSLVAKTNAQACTIEVRYKIADGTEGSSFSLSTTNSEGSAHVSMKIRGHNSSTNAPTVGTTANGAGTTPDPPNCNPGSAKDYLWIAVGSHDGNVSVSAAPTNYTDLLEHRWANTNGSGAFKATRNLNASAEDPGTFTMGSDGWITNTIAVHPGSEGLNTESPTEFPDAIDRRIYHAALQLAAFFVPLITAPTVPDQFPAVFPDRVARPAYLASEQQSVATPPREFSLARHFNAANPDSLTFSSDPTSSPLTAVTAEAWIYFDTNDEGNNGAGIIWKDTPSHNAQPAYALSRDAGNSGKYLFWVCPDDTTSIATQSMGTALPENVWYFLVGRWTSGETSELRVYDEAGNLVMSTTSASTITGSIAVNSAKDVWIGRDFFGAYIGDVCRVKIFGSKRSLEQIESDRTSATSDPSALLHAKMSGSGSTETDASGHFSAGTYVGTTVVSGPNPTGSLSIPVQFPTVYPDRLVRPQYLASEQLPWSYGNNPIVAAPFVQQTELTWYPDRLERVWLRTDQQAYASRLDPKPERTSSLESVDFPDRLDGRFYRTEQQLAVTELSPKPERTSQLAAIEFPARLEGRYYPTGEQLGVSGLSPKPERTRPLEDAEFPSRLDGRCYATGDQLASNWISPKPERTSPLADVDYPSRLDGRFFSATQQLASTELSPKPERTSPLAWELTPDAIERRVYPVAEQNPFAFVSVVVAAPAPTQFGAVYPDRLARPTYGAQLQQAVVFGGPPIAAAQFTQQVELVWFPDGIVRPRYPVQLQRAVAELDPKPERTRPLADVDFPERVARRYYPVGQQLAVTEIAPKPERTAALEPDSFPERIEVRRYPVTQQLPVTELSPKPERKAPLDDVAFPDRIDRRYYAVSQQLASTELSPKPERTSPLESVDYQVQKPRADYPVVLQLAVTELSPAPERTSPLAWEVSPDAIDRRTFDAPQQQSFALVQIVVPPPDQFPAIYQDWIDRREAWSQRQSPDVWVARPPALIEVLPQGSTSLLARTVSRGFVSLRATATSPTTTRARGKAPLVKK